MIRYICNIIIIINMGILKEDVKLRMVLKEINLTMLIRRRFLIEIIFLSYKVYKTFNIIGFLIQGVLVI